VISLKLVTDFLGDPVGSMICLRKVGKDLRRSVYKQVSKAIHWLGVESEFEFLLSPLEIRHKSGKSAFYFYGCDDPEKVKSTTLDVGYVMGIWYEELTNFDSAEEIDSINATFIREKLPDDRQVRIYYSYNPPRNPYSWVNEWCEKQKTNPDYFVHHSTYLNDEKNFLSEQSLREIERYKKNDYNYWQWMYQGEIIGLGDLVYNEQTFHKIAQLPSDDPVVEIDIWSDGGHQVSATTYLALGFTARRNVILLDTYYYSPAHEIVKKPASELSKDYADFRKRVFDKFAPRSRDAIVDTEGIDSAEGALRNQIYFDHGIDLIPVHKLKKVVMIDYVQNLLGQGRFFWLDTPENQVFYEENKRYQWDKDTLQSDDPKVIKEHDHTCDAFQYYVITNADKLGLVG
jgi:phage terminase large subunit